ncbi:ATP-dependent zinc metalloprotease FtsH [Changpingibacter yushuensis]|uniref:ATP-dependent zinc metalloprotease FtsH n=1 Tax=Changpingibacter yushuensis TaxID=2758440 RepID=UPI0015F67200|nr:ATP-dependent zinc metalloprotease FtsH [Changpingibacter yushuensis]
MSLESSDTTPVEPAQIQPADGQEPSAPDDNPPAKGGKSGEPKNGKKSRWRLIAWVIAVVVLAATLVTWALTSADRFTTIRTSEGIELLQGSTIKRAEITEGTQRVRLWLTTPTKSMDDSGELHDAGEKVQFQYVEAQAQQVADLVADANPAQGYNSLVPQASVWDSILVMAIPMLIIIAFFIFFLPRMQGGPGGFTRLRDRSLEGDRPDVTFDDVAGEVEAVEELQEITQFLTSPERFHALGARIPRGVLLYGPPGTGKTLLARAVAGEAGVPFYSISASEFVEMYVGVGASRVRKLFEQAKQNSPAIVFVDEIDAVGRGRGVGIGGGNDEREQTLNQLLVELDGFDDRTNVILIAATNRPDVLDPALLRPGRFDRQVSVDAPDLPGREAILKVHAKGKPLAEEVSLLSVARRTPGFTGADLQNILNEAALLAARNGLETIGEHEVDEAIDRVLAGPQKQSRVMNAEDRRMTAYHEGGHALAAAALHHSDPVTKVTILPRGRALGYTMVMPTEDRYSVSRNELLDQLTYAMGGRAAEEAVFGDPSAGASNDIQKATETARTMVTEYGMSAKIGAVRLSDSDSDPMTGRGGGSSGLRHSDALSGTVDAEVRILLDEAFAEAWKIVVENRDVLDTLAARLLETETILENELQHIFSNVRKAPERPAWHLAANLPASTIPPIPLPASPAEAAHGSDSDAEEAFND